jgi:hypothetical protein
MSIDLTRDRSLKPTNCSLRLAAAVPAVEAAAGGGGVVRRVAHRVNIGYHNGIPRKVRSHEVSISQNRVGHTSILMRTVAHEMIHQYQLRAWPETANTEHNAEFVRLAKRVCRVHGRDEKEFT